MPRTAPYLQRRGYGLTFRIAVPPDLRSIVGGREITKALPTSDRSHATPMALEFAACAKRLFVELRAGMAASDNNEDRPTKPNMGKLKELVRQAKHRIQLDDIQEQHFNELLEQRREHLKELERVNLEAEIQALQRVLAGFQASAIPAATPVAASACAPVYGAHAPVAPTAR